MLASHTQSFSPCELQAGAAGGGAVAEPQGGTNTHLLFDLSADPAAIKGWISVIL